MRDRSKWITVILIVLIIAVVGIVTYYTFDYIKNTRINKEAHEEIDNFDLNTPTITLAEYEEGVRNGTIKEDENNPEAGLTNGSGNYGGNGSSSGTSTSALTRAELERLFTPKVVGTIRIPKTDIKYPIYTPSGEKVLEKGIGLLVTDKGINRPGNSTLQGHNWRNWMFFSRNHLLKNGDSIFVKDRRGVEIEYIVYKKMTLKPTAASYITRNTNGRREISLSTCTNLAKDRLVILAREK